MPIPVKCSGCEAKLNAPDAAAGKKVKCPKCGVAVSVSAAGAVSAKTAPEKKLAVPPKSLSAALNKAAPKKRVEEDVDDEREDDEDEPPRKPAKKSSAGKTDRSGDNEGMVSELPENLAELVLDQLQGKERLLWAGQPDPKLMMIRAIPFTIIGSIVLIVGVVVPFFMKQPGGGMDAMGILIGLGVGALGLMVCTAPIWAKKRATKSAYALTNRRALIWKAGIFFGHDFEEYSAAEMTRMKRQNSWFVKGAGDLVFKEEVHITTTTTGGGHSRHGGYRPGHTTTSKQIIQHGFMAIPDVASVEGLIKREIIEKVMRALDED